MNFSSFAEQVADLQAHFPPEVFVRVMDHIAQPFVEVKPKALAEVAAYVWQSPTHYMDFLHLISPVDNGPEVGTLEVFYHLSADFTRSRITLPRLFVAHSGLARARGVRYVRDSIHATSRPPANFNACRLAGSSLA